MGDISIMQITKSSNDELDIIKSIVKKLNFENNLTDLQKRLLQFDYKKNTLSMSNSQPIDGQLRYYDENFGLDILNHLASMLSNKIVEEENNILIRYFELSKPEFFFIERIELFSKITVMLNPINEYYEDNIIYSLSDMYKLMNIGDVWNARRAAQKLYRKNRNNNDFLLHYGVLEVNFKNPLAAESLLKQVIDSSKESDEDKILKASARYSLAMLYMRVFERGIIPREKPEKLLNEGYEILNSLDSIKNDILLNKIFNRNGYALVLFEKRQLDTAESLMRDLLLLAQPLVKKEPRAKLHVAVLTYNLFQVEEAQHYKDYMKTIIEASRLDPNDGDYIFDIIRRKLQREDFSDIAKLLSKIQKLKIPNLEYYYSYMSNYKLHLNKQQEALELAIKAYYYNWDHTKNNYFLYNIIALVDTREVETWSQKVNHSGEYFSEVSQLLKEKVQ